MIVYPEAPICEVVGILCVMLGGMHTHCGWRGCFMCMCCKVDVRFWGVYCEGVGLVDECMVGGEEECV
jgi:hypothetical protein